MSRILIIDDEPGIRSVLGEILHDEGHQITTAPDGLDGLAILKREVIDLIFLDVWMPHMGGLDVLKAIRESYPDMTVIMMSGHASIDQAVKAIKIGAFDFAEKPLSIERVLTLVKNALHLKELKVENQSLKTALFLDDKMIGTSPGMLKVREVIEQSASSDARIMILGENGTGKELVAREIHLRSPRSRGPFIEVNCAAIPETLIESELFGHEKGAFTSAVSRRKGKFELAHGGTLFLDEVADMSLSAQAKVLRAVQEMRFERIGGEETLEVDIRIITATNKDIKKEVREGNFREDLYFRLSVIPLYIPPLRERLEDLPDLVAYFLKKFQAQEGGREMTFSPEALETIKTHLWPGNIRELKNYLERISIMVDEPVVSSENAAFFLQSAGQSPGKSADPSISKLYLGMGLNAAKDAFEKAFIEEKLAESGNNLTKAAQALGLYPSNLHSKLKKYGIELGK